MDKIEITPELLAELKEKAKKATPGPYIAWKTDFTIHAPTQQHDFIKIPNSINMDNNLAYLVAANPSVMLGLIAKIEDLQNKIHNLESWMEYNQDMMDRDSDFKYKLKVMLSLMKNSDPPVDDHKRMLEAVRELVANAKANH